MGEGQGGDTPTLRLLCNDTQRYASAGVGPWRAIVTLDTEAYSVGGGGKAALSAESSGSGLWGEEAAVPPGLHGT